MDFTIMAAVWTVECIESLAGSHSAGGGGGVVDSTLGYVRGSDPAVEVPYRNWIAFLSLPICAYSA